MTRLLPAGALATGLSLAAAGTANAQVPPSPDRNEIVSQWDHNFNNTLCVDDSGKPTMGTQIWLWHCNSNPNQRWHFVQNAYSPGGFTGYNIELDSTKSGTPLCITPSGVDNDHPYSEPGVRLVLGSCDYLAADWITVTADGSNPLMTLQDHSRTFCISTADFSDSNGTPLIQKYCDPNDLSQVWWLG